MKLKNSKKVLSLLMSLLVIFSGFSVSSSPKVSAMKPTTTKSESNDELLDTIRANNNYLLNLNAEQHVAAENTVVIPLITREDTLDPMTEEEVKIFENKIKEFKDFMHDYLPQIIEHVKEGTDINKRNIDRISRALEELTRENERLRVELDEKSDFSCGCLPNPFDCCCNYLCGLTKSFKCGLILGIVGTTIVAIIVVMGFGSIVFHFK